MSAISDATDVSSHKQSATVPSEMGRRDRRVNGRYPITLELQYKLMSKGRVEHVGIGLSLNISSGGVLFETNELLPPTGFIELAIQWPFYCERCAA